MSEEPIVEGVRPTGQRGSVLVVDDSRLVRSMVAMHLKTAGFAVEEAENGEAAMRLLSRGAFDVIITDLRMPELDGFGVLAAVKRMGLAVEVIILTGAHAQDMSSAVRALRLGAHDYLTKPPASADEVILTVERAIEKKRLREANQRLLRELESLSRTDGLTGVPNRRTFDETVAQEIARSRRHGDALGLVMLDIDHFKKINDTHGHPGGDEVLRSFARTVAGTLREGDVLFRYGGEEFVALLSHADVRGAMNAAERIVKAVAETPIQVGSTTINITTSAGVAALASCDADGSSLVARADGALYEAKRSGRNRAQASAGPLALVGAGRRAS
jgi:two-component system cell cycle response regulator